MSGTDIVATGLAIVAMLFLIGPFPVLNSLWGFVAFLILSGLFGGIIRLLRGELR